MGSLDKTLSTALAVASLAVLGFLVYFSTTPNQGEQFTEFYILDAQGKAENYPVQVALGEPVELTVGIINHEYADANYRVDIRTNGLKDTEVVTGTLSDNEKWQRKISFDSQTIGEGQKVEFWLYKNNETEPCNSNPLYLYIDVTVPGSVP